MGKEQELLEAARNGDSDTIQKLISLRPKAKKSFAFGLTSALKRAVNVNCCDGNGDSPLHLAALYGHNEAVQVLLVHEANHLSIDCKGCTALHLAAWKGSVDVCQLLLSSGNLVSALIDMQNNEGDTALHLAAQYGHSDIVNILVEYNANPFIHNLSGKSPLDLASHYGRLEVVKCLISKKPEMLLQKSTLKLSPLHLAARAGHCAVIGEFLKGGVDINLKINGQTCLHQAAMFCKVDVIKLLVSNGIELSTKNCNNETAVDILKGFTSSAASDAISFIEDKLREQELAASNIDLISFDEDENVPTSVNQSESDEHPVNQDCVYNVPRSHGDGNAEVDDDYGANQRLSFLYATVSKTQDGTDTNAPTWSNENDIPPTLPPRASDAFHSVEINKHDTVHVPVLETVPDQNLPGYLPMGSSTLTPSKPPREKPPRKKPSDVSHSETAHLNNHSLITQHTSLDISDSQYVNVNEMSTSSTPRSQISQHEDLFSRTYMNQNDVTSLTSGTYMNQNDVTNVSLGTYMNQNYVTNLSCGTYMNQNDVRDLLTTPYHLDDHLPSYNEVLASDSLIMGDYPSSMTDRSSDGHFSSTEVFANFNNFPPSNRMESTPDHPPPTSIEAAKEIMDHIKIPAHDTEKRRSRDMETMTEDLRGVGACNSDGPASSCQDPFAVRHSMGDSQSMYSNQQAIANLPAGTIESPHITEEDKPIYDSPSSFTTVFPCVLSSEEQKNASINSDGKTLIVLNNTSTDPVNFESVKCPRISEVTTDDTSNDHCIQSSAAPDHLLLDGHSLSMDPPTITDVHSMSSNSQTETSDSNKIISSCLMTVCQSDLVPDNVVQEGRSKHEQNDEIVLADQILHEQADKDVHGDQRLHEQADKDVHGDQRLHEQADKDVHGDQSLHEQADSIVHGDKQLHEHISMETHESEHDHNYEYKLSDHTQGVDRKFDRISFSSQEIDNKLFEPEHVDVNASQIDAGAGINLDRRGETADHIREIICLPNLSDRLNSSVSCDEPPVSDPELNICDKKCSPPIEIMSVKDEDDAEWDQIAKIMGSIGAGIARESVFAKEFEPHFAEHMIQRSNKIETIADWLKSLDLSLYENLFIANGFDDINFVGSGILDDGDLLEIGISNQEHRKYILLSRENFPKISPINLEQLPEDVSTWLASLKLMDYEPTFVSQGFTDMERIMKLWEVELISVLNITSLGHRKRILASLGDRRRSQFEDILPPAHLHWRSPVDVQSEEGREAEARNAEASVTLFKDYTKVRPVARINSTPTHPSSPVTNLAANTRPATLDRHVTGRHIQDDDLHIRPPQTSMTSSVKTWRHQPRTLIKGCCNYSAQYLGSTLVKELNGVDSTREGIFKMKKSTDTLAKVPEIMLSISYKGIKFIDAKAKRVVIVHDISNIFCACQDQNDLKFFAYITKDLETEKNYCHTFRVRSTALAQEIILTLGEAFEIAYQMAKKDEAERSAREFNTQVQSAQSYPEPSPKSS